MLSELFVEFWICCNNKRYDTVRSKRGRYLRSKIDTQRDTSSLWRTISDELGRRGDGALHPAPGLSAEAFADFFGQKVSDLRSATDGARLRRRCVTFDGSPFPLLCTRDTV